MRAVEILYAFDEAIRIIDALRAAGCAGGRGRCRAPAVGHGWTEAPRGLLYHRYEIDDEGTIVDAKIVPPTSQNQKSIEDDLFGLVSSRIDAPEEELQLRCEQAVRNYDPCISCATHFLRIDVERS